MRKFSRLPFPLLTLALAFTAYGPARSDEPRTLQLTLAHAIEIALANNAGLLVSREDVEIAATQIAVAQSVYAPRLVADLHYSYQHSPGSGFRSELVDQQIVANAGIVGHLPTGLDYQLDWNSIWEHFDSRIFSIYQPYQATTLKLTVAQPLLRNAGIPINQSLIRVAALRRDASRNLLQAETERIVGDVEIEYWGLALAIKEREVRQGAYELARQQLAEARTRLRLGTLSEVDVVEAQATLARRSDDIQGAAQEVTEAEGRLMALLQPREQDVGANPAIDVMASDAPTLLPIVSTLGGYLANAAVRRPDLLAARTNLQAEEVLSTLSHNRLLPQLDVVGSFGVTGFSGSLVRNGWGTVGFDRPGTALDGSALAAPLPDPSLEGGVATMLENFRFLSGQVGMRLDIPLDNAQAVSQHDAQKRRVSRQRATVEALGRQIEYQVITSYKRLLVDVERIHATGDVVKLAEQLLEGQNRRFRNGVALSFDVLRAADDLTRARIAQERALVSGRISQARLLLAQGVYLDEHHIVVR